MEDPTKKKQAMIKISMKGTHTFYLYIEFRFKMQSVSTSFQIVVHKLNCKMSVHIFFLNFPINTVLRGWSF